MIVRFWGTRGSIPTSGPNFVEFGGNTPCLSIKLKSTKEMVIFDAGTGIRELGMDIFKTNPDCKVLHLFLTHAHWDHIQGFPFFGPAYHPDYKVNIYCSKEAEPFLSGQMSPPFFPVGLEAMPALNSFNLLDHDSPTKIGDATISSIPLPHPQESTGFRIDEGETSFVFATDTEHQPPDMNKRLVKFASGCDALVYDAQYTEAEYFNGREGWGHSTYNEGVRLAQTCGAKKLILFSHDPSHDDAVCLKIEQDAQKIFPNAIAARQGLLLDLD
ncbi:MAG: phosphoribosyl 1,2-cyclic phosphodiesterase [Planctomycetota bacterium]|jgi:phosphoribosyl 1,2-cyclic phosphodiesterase